MHKARFYLVTLFPGFARLHRQLGFQFDLFRVGIGQPPICRVNGRQCPRVLGANRRIVMGASIPAASALFKLDRLGISFTPSHKAIHKCVLVRAIRLPVSAHRWNRYAGSIPRPSVQHCCGHIQDLRRLVTKAVTNRHRSR